MNAIDELLAAAIESVDVAIRSLRAIDLFAGPGGWDVGAGALGIEPIGVEYADAACATRDVAGLKTIQADVSALDPVGFAGDEGCDLLIASPPCQAWSMAGKRGGQDDLQLVYDYTRTLYGGGVYPPEWYRERCADERSLLVCEPLRWALQLQPTFIALEQVPPVLGYWRHVAIILRDEGYDVWTGILEAERYGVPQTRERAILMARRDGQAVHPPIATHQRYVPGEPARHDVTLEGEVLPWVSMAEALGWDGGDRTYLNGTHEHRAERADTDPAPTVHFGERANTVAWRVGFPRLADTPSNKSGESVDVDGTEYRARDFRDDTEPAFTVTEKSRSAIKLRAGSRSNATERDADEPAPTLTGGKDCQSNRVWLNTGRDWKKGGTRDDALIATDQPAPAIDGQANKMQWTGDRPATTVAGDPRIHPPGHKRNAADAAAGRTDYEGRAGENAIRVTVEEASVLQSFAPDYPWQGSRTKQFQQIGNAVPPLLARAVLSALTEGHR